MYWGIKIWHRKARDWNEWIKILLKDMAHNDCIAWDRGGGEK